MGTLLPVGAHTLSVVFTPQNPGTYHSLSASVALSVTPAIPALTWPTPSAITYGTALSAVQLNASANVQGTYTYTPALGTILSAGTQTLSVEFTPDDSVSYASSSATVTFTVNKATPVITWPAGPIAAGMTLGAAQFDASAFTPGVPIAVPGQFTYSPAPGTVLNSAGPQTLSAVFIPGDTVDFTDASASITETVAPFGIAAWGDSLTFGGQGTTDRGFYPTDLQNAAGIGVENLGVSAQTSTQIGVRQGGVAAYVTVEGGIIPASGGVTITFQPGYAPVTVDGPLLGVTGQIAGVHGTVTATDGISTFTPTVSGSPVSVAGTPQFVVDTPWAAYLPVFWEGRNNYGQQAQVLSDLAAQVAIVPNGKNYIVMSIINGNSPGEWSGGKAYNEIIALNNQLANVYGAHYLDIRRMLVDAYDPTQPTDLSDFAHDEVPTSLRAVLASTTLSEPMATTDTTLALSSTNGIEVNEILTIDSGANAENVRITGVSGSNVTVMRNAGGVAAPHAAGSAVIESDYLHLNANGDQVVANAVASFFSGQGPQ